MKNKKRIFLCHASEDKSKVIKVYSWLKELGYRPWLDVYDLLPGQKWDKEIRRNIKEDQSILIFFSSYTHKRGYIQREMKIALDILEEIPEGQIFIIPIRLENCTIPSNFHQFHYCNLYETRGYQMLLRTLELTDLLDLNHTPEKSINEEIPQKKLILNDEVRKKNLTLIEKILFPEKIYQRKMVKANGSGIIHYNSPNSKLYAEPKFIEIGQLIEEGDTIGYIEAMGQIFPIISKVKGIITQILISRNSIVTEGETIIEIHSPGWKNRYTIIEGEILELLQNNELIFESIQPIIKTESIDVIKNIFRKKAIPGFIKTINTPIVGTFYRKINYNLDAKPLVSIGEVVKVGTVVCIVEAMKLYNQIESELTGKIVKVLVEDQQPVDYDQPLFEVDTYQYEKINPKEYLFCYSSVIGIIISVFTNEKNELCIVVLESFEQKIIFMNCGEPNKITWKIEKGMKIEKEELLAVFEK